jgi:SAM-dependent methyltransferase
MEHLGRCPVCAAPDRALLFADVEDRIFGAPGHWRLWRCEGCRSAYLDPRPDQASIGRAYQTYYTHVDGEAPTGADVPVAAPSRPGFYARLRQRRRRGYYNHRFGHALTPALGLGVSLFSLKPRTTAQLDQQIRHLPPPTTPGAALLDVGCGDGAFLKVASSLGYAACGLEPDPVAAKAGLARGLDIRTGSLDSTSLPDAAFEHITLSHVLEHFHDPVGAIAVLHRLLAPGGRLWIAQPNIDSSSLVRFGACWRGLEAPRHLVLMPVTTLSDQLRRAGFCDVQLLKPAPEAMFYFRQSLAMSLGADPYGPPGAEWTDELRAAAKAADRAAFADPRRAESMTVVASRPHGKPL